MIVELFESKKLYIGRMMSGSKNCPGGQKCVWNANVITRSQGKVWFGDLNLTRDAAVLKEIAAVLGEPLYVLREMDCRFNTVSDPIELLILKAVWSTNE